MVHLNIDYKVYEPDGDAEITISDEDGYMVRIMTVSDKDKVYFGKFDFSFSPEVAEKLAEAILLKAKELKENK